MTAVELHRPADGGGIFRRLTVQIDGRDAAALRYNSTQVYELQAGTHVVQGRMDWTSSQALTIEVREGQTVRVEVALPASAIWGMFKNPGTALQIRQL